MTTATNKPQSGNDLFAEAELEQPEVATSISDPTPEPEAPVASTQEAATVEADAESVSDFPNGGALPDKRYFSISEAAKLCGTKPHVLRYWETEFKQLAPVKRKGNRRFYQRQDIFLIRQLRELLHVRGYTIAGARQELAQEFTKEKKTQTKLVLREVRQELEQLLKSMKH